jgi:hypothetical protein
MQGERQQALALCPPRQPQEQEDGKKSGVNQRLSDVLLDGPEEVHRSERRNEPHEPVKLLPSPPQPPDRALRRRHGERNHEKESRHSHGDVQMFSDVLDDVAEVEEHVQADVHRQVQAGVAEGDETDRPSVPGEPVPPGETAKGSDREGEHEKPQRPEPGLNLELLDRVRAQVIGEGATREPQGGQETNQDQRNRGPAPVVRSLALPWDGGCRQ